MTGLVTLGEENNKYRDFITGDDEEMYERDKQVVISIYNDICKDGTIPTKDNIYSSILDDNFDTSMEMAYEEIGEHRDEIVRNYNANKKEYQDMGVDLQDVINEELDELSTMIMNDVYWYHSQHINDLIIDTLHSEKLIYIDDSPMNLPFRLTVELLDTCRVIANDAQQVMFRELYEWEYEYEEVYNNLTDYKLERRKASKGTNTYKALGAGQC